MLEESELMGAVTLRGTDGGFTKASIESRIVKIFEKAKLWLINNHPNNPNVDIEAIETLQKSLSQHEQHIPIKTHLHYTRQPSSKDFFIDEEDDKIWAREQERFGITEEMQDIPWMTIRWIFMECYVYRLLCDYVKSPVTGIDPFAAVKLEAIQTAAHNSKLHQLLRFFRDEFSAEKLGISEQEVLLKKMLLTNLWGNKQDLSFSAGVVKKSTAGGENLENLQEKICINEIDDLIEFLMREKKIIEKLEKSKRNVAFFVDNSGEEFYLDLILGHLFISLNIFESVTYYLKKFPVFVSDVMIKEFYLHIAELKKITKISETTEKSSKNEEVATVGEYFAKEIENHLKNGRILVKDSSFLCSGLCYHEEVPKEFLNGISKFDLIISKGDFMYRKFTGDLTHNPWKITFQEWMQKCNFPTNVACLRTNKSASILGKLTKIPPDNTFDLNDNWRVDGEWGLISFWEKQKKYN